MLETILASHSTAGRDGLTAADFDEENIKLKFTASALKYNVEHWGTHASCALDLCPMLGASLACVPDEKTSLLLGAIVADGWIGLYQDPEADAPESGRGREG